MYKRLVCFHFYIIVFLVFICFNKINAQEPSFYIGSGVNVSYNEFIKGDQYPVYFEPLNRAGWSVRGGVNYPLTNKLVLSSGISTYSHKTGFKQLPYTVYISRYQKVITSGLGFKAQTAFSFFTSLKYKLLFHNDFNYLVFEIGAGVTHLRKLTNPWSPGLKSGGLSVNNKYDLDHNYLILEHKETNWNPSLLLGMKIRMPFFPRFSIYARHNIGLKIAHEYKTEYFEEQGKEYDFSLINKGNYSAVYLQYEAPLP